MRPPPATRRRSANSPPAPCSAARAATAATPGSGLPYAEAPLADLRWRAPQPLLPWLGTREAFAHGGSCPQLASPLGGDDSAPPGTVVGSEDCLYLDVYAPAFAPDAVPSGSARRPVLVWIHGGGNTIVHFVLTGVITGAGTEGRRPESGGVATLFLHGCETWAGGGAYQWT